MFERELDLPPYHLCSRCNSFVHLPGVQVMNVEGWCQICRGIDKIHAFARSLENISDRISKYRCVCIGLFSGIYRSFGISW